jgi:eukaryotic-like serine/threonine-protein kinase
MSQTDILSNSGSQLPQSPRANLTIQQSTEKPGADPAKGPLTDSVSSRFGSSVGGYEIQAELGRGGMGIVFRAFDPDLKRSVALKILSSGPSASIDELIRFRGEAELVAKLQHPNIVQIFEIGQHENMPFLALEYVDGGTLGKQIAGQPQPPRKAAEWVEVLARAVHVAHLEGVVHRDLKPANVLVTKSGILKVTDFGLAKNLESSVGLSHDGQLMGTPSYMAPEQAAGNLKLIGPRTDVYALGAILYELLTGRPPFRGATILDTLEQVRQVEPASPSRLVPKLPRELCTICLKCLEKSPERRYQSALDLAEDLRRWIDGERIKARPIPFWKRTARAVRRRPFLAAQVIIAVLLVGLVVLGITLYREKDFQDQLRAEQERTAAKERIIEQNRTELLRRSGDALDGILTKLSADEKISKMTGLEPLHEELFQFYERLLKDPLSEGGVAAEQVERLANVYRKLGELTSRSGKKDLARQAFDRSIDFFRRLLGNDPENWKWKRELASTLIERGAMSVRDFQTYSEARKELLEAQGLLRSVHEGEPGDLAAINRLAETHHLMGEVLGGENDPFGAIAAYRKAIELRNPLREQHATYPQFKRDLARDYGYLGDVQIKAGQMSEADASYWESHELRGGNLPAEEVRKLPDEARFQLARSWQNLADFQLEQRFFDTAIGFAKKSLELRESLVSENKADKLLSIDLAQSQRWAADLYLQKAILADPLQRKRSLVEGLLFLNSARARYDELYQFDKQPVDVQRGRAEVRLLLARWKLLEEPPDPQEARRAALVAKDGFRVLAERESKDGTLHYFLACATAIESEASNESSPAARTLVLNHLRQAEKCDLQKHPQTIREDRALKSLSGDVEFKAWIDSYSDRYFDRRQGKPMAGK